MLNPNIVKFNRTLGIAHEQRDGSYIFQPVYNSRYNSSTDARHDFNEFEETTKEEQIDFLRRKFVWGQVLEYHEFNNILIFEYLDKISKEKEYHIYIDFKDQNVSATSLDKAMIEALARKYDGLNTQAGLFFTRMLKIGE